MTDEVTNKNMTSCTTQLAPESRDHMEILSDINNSPKKKQLWSQYITHISAHLTKNMNELVYKCAIMPRKICVKAGSKNAFNILKMYF